ncbi:biopolymer transporter [Polynucleobacter sp. SHI8]|nr:biopolymer transporter [Polynucleobacter sp. SHI2]BDW12704.1 biopolymer transporter [Polynucleobacter sp. SHI8]
MIGLAIILERLWFLRKNKLSPTEDLERALTYLRKIHVGQSLQSSDLEDLGHSSPLGIILSQGLAAFMSKAGQLQCLELMRDTASPILVRLNQYLSTLATIATIAPLMGLFGTVLGMIEIFGSQGANGSPQQLAQGISMALYNTAFGLLIAIPAIAGWRYLRNLADARAHELNEATRVLLKNMFPQ